MQQSMSVIVFGDRGEILSGADLNRAAGLSMALCTQDLHDFVIRNMGFIVVLQNRNGCEIRLRPQVFSEITLGALLYWLYDTPQPRFVLSSMERDGDDFSWSYRLFASQASLCGALAELVRSPVVDRGQRFFHEEVAVSQLSHDDAIAEFYRDWGRGEFYNRSTVIAAAEKLFAGRYTIARVRDDKDLIIDRTGFGYTAYHQSYVDQSRGTRLEDDPDWYYGNWIAATQRNLARTGEAAIQNVDALIRVKPGHLDRFRYRRVMVPIEEDQDNRFIVSASLSDPSIDLRQAAG